MFSFIMQAQLALLRKAYTLFTYHAHIATFILYKTPFLCPFFLKYSVLSFVLLLSAMDFI